MTCLGSQGPAQVPPVSLSQWVLSNVDLSKLYTTVFEQMRSLQTGVVIKAWMSTTIYTGLLFKKFDGHFPSDNNRFWIEMTDWDNAALCSAEKHARHVCKMLYTMNYDTSVSSYNCTQCDVICFWTNERYISKSKNPRKRNPFIKIKTPFYKDKGLDVLGLCREGAARIR